MASLLYAIVEKGLLGDSNVYPSTTNVYNFQSALVGTLIGGIFMGIVFGIIEVTLFKNILKRGAFGVRILLKTCLYIGLIFVFLIVFSWFTNSVRLNLPIFHDQVINSIYLFAGNFAFVSVMIYAGVFIWIALFVSEMMDNLGMNVIANFFMGKYQKPKVEERVFMFLDMKSSTSIAEKLGHVVYYELLNTYYEDMTNAIIETEGEIYQYVGDEVVVSWGVRKGFENNNCLLCFFLIKDILTENSNAYLKSYGLVPKFKAGLHFGKVTTGEIGVIKKDILFTGDVLNTTSRIQTMCNELEVDILASNELISKLTLTDTLETIYLGEFELRGRDQKVKLSTIKTVSQMSH